tara:strand:- start:3781 stop:4395 length:615 start_codon:yes stop_codon:yes gene_type:complete
MDISVKDLGICNYNIALSKQEFTREELIKKTGKDTLILLEHNHIYTLGKNANRDNILKNDCEIIQTDRGGDVTYHGPGQLIGYPIINLKRIGLGVKSYVNHIESLLIAVVHEHNIDAHTKKGKPGVWVDNKKIGSIGIRVSHGVTSHGFSLNVNTDMNYFSNIISCGIDDILMTSMEKELGKELFIDDIKQSIILHFNRLFNIQ